MGRVPIGWPYSVFLGAGPCDPGPSRTSKRPRTEEPDDNDTDDQESDVVTLLDEAEALELVEFDPAVTPKNSWKPPKPIVTFLEKHFNKSFSEEERESIMKDFPKPDCGVLTAPKLDEQVKEHLKMKGKDPLFGRMRRNWAVRAMGKPPTGIWRRRPSTCSRPTRGEVLAAVGVWSTSLPTTPIGGRGGGTLHA